jgi:hypothetical protein
MKHAQRLVLKQFLKRLVRDEPESERHATLGLLLDIAQQGTHPPQSASIIRGLSPAPEPRTLNPDALRPASWVMSRNLEFIARADFRGDPRASVLAALAHDAGAGLRGLALARHCGGSRAKLRSALANLELAGKAGRERAEGVRSTRISLRKAQPQSARA